MRKGIFVGAIVYGVFLVTLGSPTFAEEAKKVEKKTFNLKPGGLVTVIGDNGYVRVKSWGKEQVELTMTKWAWDRSERRAQRRLEEIEVDINQSGDRLTIQVLDTERQRHFNFFDLFDSDRWGHGWEETRVDFDLMVPREVDLDIENDEGEVEITGIKGDVSVEADEGEVNLRDVQFKDLRITADEGEVTCEQVKGREGRLSINADEGRVRIEEAEVGDLQVECDEGDILLTRAGLESFRLTTDEGDIEADLDPTGRGRYQMDADEGDVFVTLPKDASLTLDLETENGHINSDFSLSVERQEEGESAHGRLGKGEARLEIYTQEGEITLEER